MSRTALTSAVVEVHAGERPRDALGVVAHARLPVVVVVAAIVLAAEQNLVHRRVEPAIHAVANQLAADDQHQHRRDERHPEQHGHQLRAEARERQRPPPLDDAA